MTTMDYTATYSELFAGDYCADGVGMEHVREFLPLLEAVKPATICEIGPGRGDVMRWARGRGHAVMGIDCAPACDDVFECDVTKINELERILRPTTPDWIWSFDVLEHIAAESIPDMLSTCFKYSRRGQIHAIWTCSDVRNVGGVPTELHINRNNSDWWLEQFNRSASDFMHVLLKSSTPDRFWVYSRKD